MLTLLGTSALSLWILWIFYLAVMCLYRAHLNKTLTLPAKIIGYPVLAVGALIDTLINVTIFTVVFLELPQETLLTRRLTRHILTGTGKRKKIATWVCRNLLDPFDPNPAGHCRAKTN